MAVGSAIAERFLQARFGDWIAHKTYAFISDGGIQEEISQGAGRLAGYLGLNNLIMFYDSNDIQLSTEVKAVTAEDTAAKYRAWNWNVIEVDGTDPLAMAGALETAIEEKHRPTIIIGKTVMGRGAVTAEGESYEGKCSTHGNPLSKSVHPTKRPWSTSEPIPRIPGTSGKTPRSSMPTVPKCFAQQ